MDEQLKNLNSQEQNQVGENYLDRQFWRLWTLLVFVSVVTTGCLALTMRSFHGATGHPWPWGGTETILLGGLFLLVAASAGYLTIQQKRIIALRTNLRRVRESNAENSRRHRSRLVAFYSVSQVLADTNDPQSVFDRITSMCHTIFESERVSLMLLDSRTREFEVKSAVGHPDIDRVLGSRRKWGEGISGSVAIHKEPLLLKDEVTAEEYPGHVRQSDRISSAMVVPLIVRDEVVGVLNVGNHTRGIDYNSEDLAALKIFGEIAEYSIRHYEQAHWMRQTIGNLSSQNKPELVGSD
jgi:transcriptional regulator with GAF, ATPase, and Fis domain